MGRRLLVGVTYRDEAGTILRQEQYCGPVLEVVDGVVVVDRPGHPDGPGVVPADAHAYDRAARGRYVLAGTGETVVDPDYVSTWDVVVDPQRE